MNRSIADPGESTYVFVFVYENTPSTYATRTTAATIPL